MTSNSLPMRRGTRHLLKSEQKPLNVQIAQERIYKFLLKIVKTWQPQDVLREFKRLFMDCLDGESFGSISGIYGIFINHDEREFRNTLKRCCYILINNWESHRQYKYIQQLIELFANYQPKVKAHNFAKINVYVSWIENFINSKDYQELKLFISRYDEQEKNHWVNRYTSYLLVAQSLDRKNPKEQQEAARKFSRKLKDKFKFELAMYIARSQSPASHINRYRNPSIFGDNTLRLIKSIIVKKGVFSYENIANIFIKQTYNQTLEEFKYSLQKYLIFSVNNNKLVENLQQQLSDKLSSWKTEHNQKIINKDLLLRICNKLVDYLTTENKQEPSPLFVLLLSQGHPLTLVIILLKIILISRNTRSHLEVRIADLIRYYNQYPENECQWVIHFLEIFNITFAIYADNVEYNLVKVENQEPICDQQQNLDAYRVFSQVKEEIQI